MQVYNARSGQTTYFYHIKVDNDDISNVRQTLGESPRCDIRIGVRDLLWGEYASKPMSIEDVEVFAIPSKTGASVFLSKLVAVIYPSGINTVFMTIDRDEFFALAFKEMDTQLIAQYERVLDEEQKALRAKYDKGGK